VIGQQEIATLATLATLYTLHRKKQKKYSAPPLSRAGEVIRQVFDFTAARSNFAFGQ